MSGSVLSCRNCGTSFVKPLVDLESPVIEVDGMPVNLVIPGITTRLVAVMVASATQYTCEDCYASLVAGLVRLSRKAGSAQVVPAVTTQITLEAVEAVEPEVVESVVDLVAPAEKLATETIVVQEPVVAPVVPVVATVTPAPIVPVAPAGMKNAVAVYNAIVDGKSVGFSGKKHGEAGNLLTQCIVGRHAPASCLCGGWGNWAEMPVASRVAPNGADQHFCFGKECATAIGAAIVSKGGKNPFDGAKTLQEAIEGSLPQRSASVPPVARPVRVKLEESPVTQILGICGIGKPTEEAFASDKEAVLLAKNLKETSEAFGRYSKLPNNEERAILLAFLAKTWAIPFGANPGEVKFTSDNAIRISQICNDYLLEAKKIAGEMAKVVSFSGPAREKASADRVERERRAAVRRENDAALRAEMKGKGGGGGQKKAGGKKK